MNINSIQTVILNTLTTFSGKVLIIITAVIAVGLAYLIFSFGWQQIKHALDAGMGRSEWGDRPRFFRGERVGKTGTGHWSF